MRLFYISEIVGSISQTEVQVILGASLINNRRLDVTGMIAQSDGHFAQILEGRTVDIDVLMARIRRDPLHRDVRVILQEPIARRQFARWAMGLIRRDDLVNELRAWHQGAAPVDLDEAHDMIRRLYPTEH